MPSDFELPLNFKFHWLNENGEQTGLMRKKGHFDGDALVLDDVEISIAVIVDVQFRENRMFVTAIGENQEAANFGFSSDQRMIAQLKTAIDTTRSTVWAESHREELSSQGRDGAFRQEECPQCQATLILTDMSRTPQLYCHFCDTLSTVGSHEEPPVGEENLRLCEECGMYCKPTKFTVFYFYFLLVVYGWRSYSTTRCPGCMRGDAWKMFFGNLLFVIGVPVAIVQLNRAYGGGIKGGPFAGLDKANLKARSNDLSGALVIYREILERVPHSAGLKYNVGLALLHQEDASRAADSLRLALDDCSNYVPAYHALSACYEELGETEKLKDLRAVWGEENDEPPEQPAEIEDFE